MGIVWLAHDLRLKEPVALKFVAPSVASDPVALEDLRRETLRSRRLSHPNIVRIYDLYEAPGELAFISMEYVDGPNLHYLRANRPSPVLPWRLLLPLIRQTCEALDYAHKERVLHRDLKPSNLMLDSNERLKLADFGLARAMHEAESAGNEPMSAAGTLAYMSPQQADGNKPQVADDIYSLGATLYELLTSKPPFYTGDAGYQLRNNRPQAMHERLADLELENDIPSEAVALVMACLAKEPAERPRSARQVLEWLQSTEGSSMNVSPPEDDDLSSKAVEPAASRQDSRSKGKPLLTAGITLLCVLLVQFWVMRSLRAKRAVAPVVEQGTGQIIEAGFQSMFKGKDLAGWSSEPGIWSVQEGVIRGQLPASKAERRSRLVWRGGLAADFELRAECRLIYGKAAIFYRAKELGANDLSGYELILSPDSTGEMVSVGPSRSYTLTRPAKEASPGVSWAAWVQIEIRAQGNHLVHKVNGNVVGDARDGPSWAESAPSLLGLDIMSGAEETTVEFRNIRIKRIAAPEKTKG
jgi:hypothetical protein